MNKDVQTDLLQDELADKGIWSKRLESGFKSVVAFGPALTTRAAYLKAVLFVLLVWKGSQAGTWALLNAMPDPSLWRGLLSWISAICSAIYFVAACAIVARRLGTADGLPFLGVFIALCCLRNFYADSYELESMSVPLFWLIEAGALFAFLLYPNRWTQWVDAKMSRFRGKYS